MKQPFESHLPIPVTVKKRPETWPLDEPITHYLFSFLTRKELSKASFTCGFFYHQAQQAGRTLIKQVLRELGASQLDQDLPPNVTPIALLPYLDIIMRPISTGVYNPLININPGTQVTSDVSSFVLTKIKNSAEFCFVGTFALPPYNKPLEFVVPEPFIFRGGYSHPRFFQFISGVNKNNCVYVKRVDHLELKSLVEEWSPGEQYCTSLSTSAIGNILWQLCCASVSRQPFTLLEVIKNLEPFCGRAAKVMMQTFIELNQPTSSLLPSLSKNS